MSKCLNIIHVSDLHVRLNQAAPESYGAELMGETIVQAVGKENDALLEKNTVVLVTGDLTESGLTTEFSRFSKTILRNLKASHVFFSAIPGNHDFDFLNKSLGIERKTNDHQEAFIPGPNGYKGLDLQFSLEENDSKGRFYPVYFKARGHHFIGLNSSEAVGARCFLPRGKFGKKQLNLLGKKLNELQSRDPSEKVILFTHHHPFPLPFGGDQDPDSTHSMLDWEAFGELMASIAGKLPPVDVLLFGHEHIHMNFSEGSPLRKYIPKKFQAIPVILSSGKTSILGREVNDVIDSSNPKKRKPVLDPSEKRLGRLIHFCRSREFVPEFLSLDLSTPLKPQVSQNFKKCCAG